MQFGKNDGSGQGRECGIVGWALEGRSEKGRVVGSEMS